jgi:O-antigen/teichoic acid export membrane protein
LAGSENDSALPAGAELLRAPVTRSVGLNSTGVFVISILIQAIGFASTLVLYQLLPRNFPSPGGAAAAACATATMHPYPFAHAASLLAASIIFLLIAASINQLADLRMGAAFIYFVARGQSAKQLSGTFLALRFLFVGVGSLVAFLVLPRLLSLHAWSTDCGVGDVYLPFAVFMLLPTLMNFSTFYNQYYVAVGQSIRAQYPMLVESVFRTVALIVSAVFVPSIWGLTAAYTVGVVASAAFSAPIVIRMLGPPLKAEVRRLFAYAAPLMGGLLLQYVIANVTPFLLLGLLGESVGQTAVYVFSPVNGFRILLMAIPIAISVPLFPNLAALHAGGALDAVKRRVWRALRYTAMLLVPGAVALVVYRVTFLTLFNNQVVGPGQVPLAILAVSAFAYGLALVITIALNAVGRQVLELYLTIVQAAILVVASIILIPLYQLTGSAIAILLSSVAALLLNVVYMERYLRVKIQLRPILTIFASAAATFFVFSRINAFVTIRDTAALVTFVFIGFVVYALVLAAVGELSKEDVRILSSSLGFPSPVGEVLSRLCWRVANNDGYGPLTPAAGRPPPSGR